MKREMTSSEFAEKISKELSSLGFRQDISNFFGKGTKKIAKDLAYTLIAEKGVPKTNHKRIYHYHTRKTGGTSLNFSFLASTGVEPQKIYARLINNFDNRQMVKRKVFVGWNFNLIERGDFFYGWTHKPAHKLRIKENTFTLTVLRNPADRIISLYKHLLQQKENKVSHPKIKREIAWLGTSFEEFIENIPERYLKRQLYMFSKRFDIEEAYEEIRKLSYFFFLDNFEKGVKDLSKLTGVNLKPMHIRKSKIETNIKKKDLDKLNKLIEDEIKLFNKLRVYKGLTKYNV